MVAVVRAGGGQEQAFGWIPESSLSNPKGKTCSQENGNSICVDLGERLGGASRICRGANGSRNKKFHLVLKAFSLAS